MFLASLDENAPKERVPSRSLRPGASDIVLFDVLYEKFGLDRNYCSFLFDGLWPLNNERASIRFRRASA